MACILVIDDEPEFRTVVREVLTEAGYTVVEASDGREGLRMCHVHPVDLVLTDLLMPEQDGFETIRTLRSLRPTVKMIAVSGGGVRRDLHLLRMAEFMGANRILPKPVRRQALLDAVRTLLAGP